MTSALARGQRSTTRTPVLSTFFVAGGVLFDPGAIEYAIFERVTEDYPLQVFPETGLRAVVDVREPPLGTRLGVGHYAALWEVPIDAQVGRYEIHWWYRMEIDDDVEYEIVQPFEVLTFARARGPQYAFVADMREEGVMASRVNDASLHEKLVRASRLFELYTGRSFEPKFKAVRTNGRGHGAITFEEPIIALESVHAPGDPFYTEGLPRQDLSLLRVYNRHLSGLTEPDDRENPRIEWGYQGPIWGGRWVRGQQNILVRGVFGYTDPDDLVPTGTVPDLVRHAVKLLAFKDLPRLYDLAERDDFQKRWRLTGESTKEQMYTMFGGVDAATRGALVGGTTGDPEIDNIIILYRKGSQVGAA